MFQCLVCEEWLHESCTVLGTDAVLAPDSFDGVICDACMRAPAAQLLRQYAGTRGWMLLARDGPPEWDGQDAEVRGSWKVYGAGVPDADAGASEEAEVTVERSDDGPLAKRPRSACRAPRSEHPCVAQPTARLDVFLAPDFRQRLCRCAACRVAWRVYPYVYEEETTYVPPVEADDAASSTSSSYDRAVAALGQLPRPQMLESLRAYQGLRDALYEHLRPFAERGELVSEEAVRAFFREHQARPRSRAP